MNVPPGDFYGVPIPDGDTGASATPIFSVLPASPFAGRRGTRRNRVLSAPLRENGPAGDSERIHRSLGQRRVLGRRKEAERNFATGDVGNRFCRLDETDSGLDIDALKVVAKGVNTIRGPGIGILLITHYQRLLNYIVPDFVHVMSEGRIVRSGGKELALELESKGYDWLKEEKGEPWRELKGMEEKK